MTNIISDEIKMIPFFFLSGFLIGIIFDFFRIIRRSFKISDIHTNIEDIILSILIGIILFFMLFIYNSSSVRFFMVISIIVGTTTYLLTISKIFIKVNVKIIILTKIICMKILNIIILPFKLIESLARKLFRKQFTLLIVNIKKITNKIKYNIFQKKTLKKKDFRV